MRRCLALTVIALAIGAAAPAAAAASCDAQAPPVGAAFSGPVLEVIDGERLCVAFGPTPAQWVEVHLADVQAQPDRRMLMAATFSQKLDCVTVAAADHGVDAVCTLAGASVGQLVRTAGQSAEYRLWR